MTRKKSEFERVRFFAHSWNLLQCFCLLSWRTFKAYSIVEDDYPNNDKRPFSLYLCSVIYLANILFCIVSCSLSNQLLLAGNKYKKTFFIQYGLFLPVFLHILSILFGAPFFKNWQCTLSFALLATALVLPNILINNKVNKTLLHGQPTIMRLEWLENKEVICTLGGAWCASFVIPLDWDRPWQIWPEPCCIGAIIGCSLGNLVFGLFGNFNNIVTYKSIRSA